MLDALPAHVALLDAHGIIRWVNRAWRWFAEANGARPDSVSVGCSYLEVCEQAHALGCEPAGQVAAELRAVLGGAPRELVLEYPCHSEDEERWFEVRVSPGEGDPDLSVLVMHVDVTERVLAERRRRVAEERFGLLARASRDALYDWDLASEELWWSEGLMTGFGHDPASARRIDAWAERVHPDDHARVQAELQRVLGAEGASFSAEYRFLHANGTYAHVLDRGEVLRDAGGDAVRMVGSMTDLTERRLAEERVAEQAALMDGARDAILVRDLDGGIKYVNEKAERLYGWTREEAIGKDARDLWFSNDPDLFERANAQVLERGAFTGELQQVRRDGQFVLVDARWTLLSDERGRPRSVLVVNTDVTDQKRLEQHMLRAQRMESIGTLAGGMAHDLNNLLAPILGSVELLKLDETDPERIEMLDTIEACTARGTEMIRQLMTFARGADGRASPLDLAGVADDVRRIVRDTFPKNVELSLSCAQGLWRVSADRTQILQVLMNLCVNARDAMPSGGRLRVTMCNSVLDEQTASQLGMGPAGDRYVVITVEDEGVGMPPAVLERIFDPFFTTKEVGKGTGLGLPTTDTIVRRHGGFCDVRSTVGGGTTFRVFLPALGSGEVAFATAEPTALLSGQGELVLVVDDEPDVRATVRRTLERFGYRVLMAAHGAEAVALYERRWREIAVVFTDLAMPVMDGPSMVVALRAVNPAVRVVASSGLDDGKMWQALGAGVNRFVAKPYRAGAILRAVREAIGS